jgi:hypothetical protein
MPHITVALANGRQIAFEVAPAGHGPHFLLGVRKSGSSILNNIVKALARLDDRNFVDVGDTFFAANVLTTDWQSDPALRDLLRRGNIYGGFRDMPLALRGADLFDEAPKLLMVRDPRDALVSEYFSNAFSHNIPQQTGDSGEVTALMLEKRQQARGQDIADFVLHMAAAMNDTMMLYAPLVGQQPTLVLKYEDMIFDKRALIAHIGRQFSLAIRPGSIDHILGWADKRPTVEDPHAFVRKVRPGDHIDKLDAATIARLNEMLRPSMEVFGYQP